MSEQGISAIDSLYNYGVDTLAYDKYFLQAYQSPNNYYAAQAQQAGTTQQAGSATNTQSTESLKDVNFKGASDAITENQEKKSSAAGWLLTGVGTIITGLAAWKCHGRGVKKLGEKAGAFEAIGRGFKEYWNQGIDAIRRLKFQNAASNEASSIEPIRSRVQSRYTQEVIDEWHSL